MKVNQHLGLVSCFSLLQQFVMKSFFAVDLGATSGRTVLASFDGEKVTMKEITRFDNPIIPLSGHLYWDLANLYYGILKGLKEVSRLGVTLESIGVDTWGCDFAFFTSNGQLLGLPHSYRDQHTEGAQERFFKKMPAKEIYKRTGTQFLNLNSLFQLDTLQHNNNQVLKNADKILFIPDAIIYMLTGKAICEYTVASTSQFLNPVTKELDSEILKALGIPREKFGPMTQPGTLVGPISKQVQEFSGLGDIPVVAVAGHDTASAVVAVPAQDSDYAYLSCGTWSLLGIESPKPIISEESFRANLTNEGGVEGTTRFLKNICGLWLFEQSRKEFVDVPSSVGELVALSEKSSFEGLINPDDPSFLHPTSMIEAIRDYCIATGQSTPKTPADFCRCIFRSLALRYRQVINMIESISDLPIKKFHVIGGGSQNKYLMQCTANALNMPVICGPVEGTALGNVLMQMKTAGIINTLEEMRKISAASVELVTYFPKEVDVWEKEYQRFIKITTK